MSSIDNYSASISTSISKLDELSQLVAAAHATAEEVEGELGGLGATGTAAVINSSKTQVAEAQTALASVRALLENGQGTAESAKQRLSSATPLLLNPATSVAKAVPPSRTALDLRAASTKSYGPVASQPGKPPNNRHDLNRIGKGAPSKAENTVAIPPTNMANDVAAINAGNATFDPNEQTYTVMGRRYKIKSNGTMYPLDGPGLVNLSRAEFNALKVMVRHKGDLDTAWEAIRRDPRMSRSTFDSVKNRVYRHHNDYKGG
jgi:hypothetical protein